MQRAGRDLSINTEFTCYVAFEGSPRLPEVDTEPEEVRLFQLGLEEAFFLTSELKCIFIYQQTSEV